MTRIRLTTNLDQWTPTNGNGQSQRFCSGHLQHGENDPHHSHGLVEVTSATSYLNYLQFAENFDRKKHKIPMPLYCFGSISQVLDSGIAGFDVKDAYSDSFEEFKEINYIQDHDLHHRILEITASLNQLDVQSP